VFHFDEDEPILPVKQWPDGDIVEGSTLTLTYIAD